MQTTDEIIEAFAGKLTLAFLAGTAILALMGLWKLYELAQTAVAGL